MKASDDPRKSPPLPDTKTQFPEPYIREVTLGSDQIRLAVANGGFTVVMPTFSTLYERTLFVPPVGFGLMIKQTYILPGVDTEAIYSAADINNLFKIGDRFEFELQFHYQDQWYRGTSTKTYTVVT
ncbi:Uncharacterised protein [Paucimonas lemoignei]|jgi:hypothetical protein|nr:Uncharacterised protein [Paucimonas lemoignei]